MLWMEVGSRMCSCKYLSNDRCVRETHAFVTRILRTEQPLAIASTSSATAGGRSIPVPIYLCTMLRHPFSKKQCPWHCLISP